MRGRAFPRSLLTTLPRHTHTHTHTQHTHVPARTHTHAHARTHARTRGCLRKHRRRDTVLPVSNTCVAYTGFALNGETFAHPSGPTTRRSARSRARTSARPILSEFAAHSDACTTMPDHPAALGPPTRYSIRETTSSAAARVRLLIHPPMWPPLSLPPARRRRISSPRSAESILIAVFSASGAS